MAVITISNTGGNYNAGGTWVGGVAPGTGDSVLGVTSSGPLTINVSTSNTGFDFTNYTNTLTCNFTFTCNGSMILGASMSLAGAGIMTLGAVTANLKSNGKVWSTIPFATSSTGGTFTLQDNWTFQSCSITMAISSGQTLTLNVFQMNFGTSANLTNSGNGSITGTTILNWSGANTWFSSTTNIGNPLVFNLSGTLTLSSATLNYFGTSITYTSGTISLTGGHTLTLSASSTITMNTSGMTWINISVTPTTASTITGQDLVCSNTLSGSAGANFTITFSIGFTCATFNFSQSGTSTRYISLTPGQTYIVTSSLVANTATAALGFNLNSSSPGTRATLKLNPGATMDIGYMTITDIDSSSGRTIWAYKSTLSNTINWNTLTIPKTIATTF